MLERLTFPVVVFVLFMMTIPSSLPAQFTVSGRVTDPLGGGAYPVDIDVEDSQTGDPIPIWGDSTDTAGNYAFSIFQGLYDILFIPDPGTGLAPVVERRGLVQSSINLDVTTPWGVEISGTVTDPSGNPVENVDIDVVDSGTGDVLLTPSDNTDVTGHYSVLVPEGLYNVVYTPRPDDSLSTLTLWEVYVQADTTLDVTLPMTVILWGWVKNELGQGIANVDLDVDDALTGRRIPTSNDNTDDTGFYSIFVPEGLLDVMYEPDPGSGYADNAIWDLVVNHDLNLDITVENGVQITGTVTSNGQPVPNLDLDVDDSATGRRLHTPHDNTDSGGNYNVTVPTGTYDISYEPSPGQPVAARVISGQVISGNTVLNQNLPVGYTISGTITDDGGSPVGNCDIDVIDSGTQELIPTPGDNSDSNGDYIVTVPAGTYDMLFQPPGESGVGEGAIPGVTVGGNIVRNKVLPRLFDQAVGMSPVNASVFPGDQIFEDITLYNNDTQARRVQVRLDVILPGGGSLPILPPYPPNGVNLPGGAQVGGTLPVAVPGAAPPNLEVTLKGLILDFNQGDTLNVDSTGVRILDPNDPAN